MSLIFWAMQAGKLGSQLAKGIGERDAIVNSQLVQAAARIQTETIITELRKVHFLLANGVLNHQEFTTQKRVALNQIEVMGVAEAPMDALRAFMPLVSENILTVEELKHIKTMLES